MIVQSTDPGDSVALRNKLHKVGGKERTVGVKDVPDGMVEHINVWAISALKEESDHLTRAQIQIEMLAMALCGQISLSA